MVSIARVERLLARHPRARADLFTARELEQCEGRRRSAEHLAGRVAAKEAVFKLLGRGFGQGLRWQDVEVISDERGKPEAILSGNAAAWAEAEGVQSIELSLSHDSDVAIAQAAALTRD